MRNYSTNNVSDKTGAVQNFKEEIDARALRMKKMEFFRDGYENIKGQLLDHLNPRLKISQKFLEDFHVSLKRLDEKETVVHSKAVETWKRNREDVVRLADKSELQFTGEDNSEVLEKRTEPEGMDIH